MRALLLTVLAALASAGLSNTAAAFQLGTNYCFGVACPCGNDDPNAGCANESGTGAFLTAVGSASVSTDDLQLVGTNLAVGQVAIVIASKTQQTMLFRDGLLCMGFPFTRLQVHRNSGAEAVVRFENIVSKFALQGPGIQPGDTWNYQIWYRDGGNDSPCGAKANTTQGVTITFEP